MTERRRESLYKLVALDIDGTLINKEGEVASKTRKALELLLEMDIGITLATGRMWPSVKYFVESLKLKEPVILHNGALVRQVERPSILHYFSIEEPLITGILSLLNPSPFDYLLCTHHGLRDYLLYSMEPKHPWAKALLQGYHDHTLFMKEISLDGHSLLRVLVFGEKKPLLVLKERFENQGLKVLFFSGSSSSAHMEVFAKDCSKAAGLDYLAKMKGLLPKEILVIGDDINDLEMIQYAGCGVAMGTSPKILKDAADYVTLSAQEGGVGEALEALLLGKNSL